MQTMLLSSAADNQGLGWPRRRESEPCLYWIGLSEQKRCHVLTGRLFVAKSDFMCLMYLQGRSAAIPFAKLLRLWKSGSSPPSLSVRLITQLSLSEKAHLEFVMVK